MQNGMGEYGIKGGKRPVVTHKKSIMLKLEDGQQYRRNRHP